MRTLRIADPWGAGGFAVDHDFKVENRHLLPSTEMESIPMERVALTGNNLSCYTVFFFEIDCCE